MGGETSYKTEAWFIVRNKITRCLVVASGNRLRYVFRYLILIEITFATQILMEYASPLSNVSAYRRI